MLWKRFRVVIRVSILIIRARLVVILFELMTVMSLVTIGRLNRIFVMLKKNVVLVNLSCGPLSLVILRPLIVV